MQVLAKVALVALLSGCGGASGPTPTPTVEYMLAVINGEGSHDPVVEQEFAEILDRIEAGGCESGDREDISDTIVAGWEASGKAESLLAFARALADLCG